MVDNLARKLDNAPKAEIEISEAPVKWCSVSLAEMIERGKRLEASVFDLFEGGRVLRQINGVVTHAQLCELLFGGFALRVARIGEDGHGHSISSLCKNGFRRLRKPCRPRSSVMLAYASHYLAYTLQVVVCREFPHCI